MAAPHLTFSITGEKISAVSGFDKVIVAFQSDISYQAFECRATKVDEDWGRGKGALIASFSQTPANTQRQFDVYDDFLLKGDGEYRISLMPKARTEAGTTITITSRRTVQCISVRMGNRIFA